jgi:methyl-accepting chemotaxis protein
MSMLRFKLYAYRNRLVPMCVLMIIPYLAIAPQATWWANAIGLPLLLVCGSLLFVHVLPMPPANRRANDDQRLSDSEILKMRKTAEPASQQLMQRWAQVTRDSKLQLEEVDQHVTEVMSHAESAVVEIGKRFVEVTRKTRKQVELAVGLLSSTGGADAAGGGKQDSLTDYIHASDSLLKNLGGQLVSLSDQLAALSARQEAVREESKRIDGALDQLAALASEVRVLALDSGRRGNSADNRAFVEMTDRVRALSLTADESSRAIRNTLEDIKTQARTTDDAIRAIATQAREAGRKSSDQIGELTGATLRKSEQVNTALGEIGALGERIQGDINKIIIELQFQDITQQKLQRLKAPMLSELASSWLAMFEETRTFNRKLGTSAAEAPDAPAAPFRVSLKKSTESAAAPDPAAKEPAATKREGDGSTKVELF